MKTRYLTDGRRHLICVPYGIAELHAMADALGIARRWFHRGCFPHYDIPKTRISEISAQCVIVRPREIVRIIQQHQMALSTI